MPDFHAEWYGSLYVAVKQQYFHLNLDYLRFISYLCTQIEACSGTLILTALANVHPQYSY